MTNWCSGMLLTKFWLVMVLTRESLGAGSIYCKCFFQRMETSNESAYWLECRYSREGQGFRSWLRPYISMSVE